jgi:hypothetical protein
LKPATEKGRKYDPDAFNPFIYFSSKYMGMDPIYDSIGFTHHSQFLSLSIAKLSRAASFIY